MKLLKFFWGKNCNNEYYVCHTVWPSASRLHAANLEIRWVVWGFFYRRNKSVNCTWEWRLLRQLLQLPTRFSDSDVLISFQCHLVMPPGYRLQKLVFHFNLFNSQKRRQTVMDVLMFFIMYEGENDVSVLREVIISD